MFKAQAGNGSIDAAIGKSGKMKMKITYSKCLAGVRLGPEASAKQCLGDIDFQLMCGIGQSCRHINPSHDI